jgi:hypothetical protein
MSSKSLAGAGPGFHVNENRPVNGCHDTKEVLLQRYRSLPEQTPSVTPLQGRG